MVGKENNKKIVGLPCQLLVNQTMSKSIIYQDQVCLNQIKETGMIILKTQRQLNAQLLIVSTQTQAFVDQAPSPHLLISLS